MDNSGGAFVGVLVVFWHCVFQFMAVYYLSALSLHLK